MPNPINKTSWTPAMEQFLKDNFKKLTNRQLAKVLGLTLTVTRNKLYELQLKRMEMEYWTDEQISLLKQAYTLVGDLEISQYFAALFEKKKGWTEKHINKKRRYLNLHRTPEQIINIKRRNVDLGCGVISNLKRWDGRVSEEGTIKFWNAGRTYLIPHIKTPTGWTNLLRYNWEKEFGPIPPKHCVIIKDEMINDYSINNLKCIEWKEMSRENFDKNDKWLAGKIAGGDKELRDYILKNNPELLVLKRSQLILRRELKNVASKQT